MWSQRRLPDRLASTAFARRLDTLVDEAGAGLLDLTFSNPSRGFSSHRRTMSRKLQQAAGQLPDTPYEPVSRGLPVARRAVAGYLRDRGASINDEEIVLTASTSEAYSWLARVCADPGDAILVPTPSYPLFEHLLRLEAVEILPYEIRYEGGWRVDIGTLRRTVERRRDLAALFTVRPNNPTGHLGTPEDWRRLHELAAAYQLPLVIDEVFLDFDVEYGTRAKSALAGPYGRTPDDEALIFALGGLSKAAGLPGAKLGWIAVQGPSGQAREALERLSFVADTYLSASTVTQLATPAILDDLDNYHRLTRARLSNNLEVLDALLENEPALSRYRVQAGWYAIVRAPGFLDEAEFVLDLVDEADVLVQPGFFYDLEPSGHLVVSLLTAPSDFEEGCERMLDALSEKL
jgi:aspartate/methionine/tyrosine aminotransferase